MEVPHVRLKAVLAVFKDRIPDVPVNGIIAGDGNALDPAPKKVAAQDEVGITTVDRVDDETSADPWFYVGENDIFPEEFIKFFGLQPNVKGVFIETHGDLLSVDFWTTMQERIRAGEIVDVFPYPQSRRLRNP